MAKSRLENIQNLIAETDKAIVEAEKKPKPKAKAKRKPARKRSTKK